MQTNKARWQRDSDGTWICFLTDQRTAGEVCSSIEPGKTYDVTVKEHKDRRSKDANAYCWTLLDKLAMMLRRPKTELYRAYIKEIGGNSDTVCVVDKAVKTLRSGWERNGLGWQTDTMPSKIKGCTNVILYYGSSSFDTAQMSRLIDLIVEDCRAVGIETLPPHRLDALKEEWGRASSN